MLRKAGLNVVRMNFSHGAYEYHQSVIDHSREAERQIPGRPLAIALDTVQEPASITAKPLMMLICATERSRDSHGEYRWRCRHSHFPRP